MDASVVIAIVGAVGSLIGVVIANRYTARIAKNAQLASQQIEEKKVDVASWQDQVRSWRDDVKQLRELRVQDRTEYDQEIDRATTRIEALEASRIVDAQRSAEQRAHLNAFIAWARVTVDLMRRADMVYPTPPQGVFDTDSRGN